jgi:hypothetical protein
MPNTSTSMEPASLFRPDACLSEEAKVALRALSMLPRRKASRTVEVHPEGEGKGVVVGELLDTLRDQGLVRSVAKLRELLGAADPI